nr:type IV secretion system DNA-binding domain-containing protein [Paraglaciecola arctica]
MVLFIATLRIQKLVNQGKLTDYAYISGPKLLEKSVAIRDVKKKVKKEPSSLSIKIHPEIRITEQIAAGSIFLQGQSGAGKSTIIKPIVQQIYALPVRSFTYDEKGEYQATFNTSSAVCLKLIHNSEYFWNIGRDITTKNDAALVSQAFIEQENENQRFFTDSARQILKNVIIFLIESRKPWSWCDLSQKLFSTEQELKSLLATVSKSAATLVEPGTKTTQSIRSVLSTKLFWLDEMAEMQKTAKNIWSISDLINKKSIKTHVFFRPNYMSPDITKAVCNSLITLLIERWLNQNDSKDEMFWLLLDELGNLPKNPSLIRWLTLSRSKGGRTVASTQDISQLYECYGENITDTILSLFRTVIVMRLGASGPSAQKVSDLLGQQRVLTLNQSLSEDQRISISTQYHDRPVVSREEIVNLPSADKTGVEGFLFIGGLKNIYKLKWPYLKQSLVSGCEEEQTEPLVLTDVPKKNIETNFVNRLNKRKTLEKQAIEGHPEC